MKWEKPQVVDALTVAFGGDMKNLLPPMKDIPEDFQRETKTSQKWYKFQSDWFFWGIEAIKMDPHEGIDSKASWNHLAAINGSFEPKHEHKEAAVAWLASLWFKDVQYVKGRWPESTIDAIREQKNDLSILQRK